MDGAEAGAAVGVAAKVSRKGAVMRQFFLNWQTLIGAAVAGSLGVVGALIVAHTNARRTEEAAGKLLMVDLLSVMAAAQNLRRLAQESGVIDASYPMWVVKKLAWRWPTLSPLFDAQMAALLHIDNTLGAHLTLFRKMYGLMGEHFAQVREEFDRAGMRVGDPVPPPPNAERHAKAVAGGLVAAGEHAKWATHLIEVLVLGRWPRVFIRLRMKLRPTENERRAGESLNRARSVAAE